MILANHGFCFSNIKKNSPLHFEHVFCIIGLVQKLLLLLVLVLLLLNMIVKAEGNQVLISGDNPLDVGPVAPPNEDNQDS